MKNKVLRICYIISAVIIIICIVRCFFPLRTFSYDLSGRSVLVGNDGKPVVESGISLPPGIWNVSLQCDLSEDIANAISLRDDSLSAFFLKTNGTLCYEGLERQSFDVFLFSYADSIEVYFEQPDEGMKLYELKIQETRLLWTRIIAIVLFVNAVISLSVWLLRDGGKLGTKEGRKVFLFVTLIGVIASIPLFKSGVNASGDFLYHIHRIEGIRASILSGIFPSRIEPHWQQGYGYADGIFYCPLFLYVPGIMRCIGFTVSEAFNFYSIACAFATAWVSYYAFSRIFKHKFIGVICSATYSLSMMHIGTWITAPNFGEGTAMIFLPLVVLGTYRLLFEESGEKEGQSAKTADAWLPLAIGMSGIVQSHVLSSEMTAFVLGVTCIVFLKRLIKRGALLSLFKAAGLAVLMCLWYLIPFAEYYFTQDIMVKHVSDRTIQSMGVYPAQHMLNFYSFGTNSFIFETGLKGISNRGMGLVFVAGLGMFFALMISGKITAGSKECLKNFAVYSFVAGAILMAFSLSFFPWDRIQESSRILKSLVSSLQFSGRWCDLSTTFITVVIGYLLLTFESYRGKAGLIASASAVLILVLSSTAFYYSSHETHATRIDIYNGEGFGMGYTAGQEYIIYGSDPRKYVYNRFVSSDNVSMSDAESAALKASLNVLNASDTEGWIEVPLAYYKGYRAYGDGCNLRAVMGDNAVVRVCIPAGYSGHVVVKFVSPWYWRVTEIISLITYIALVVWAVKTGRNKDLLNEV